MKAIMEEYGGVLITFVVIIAIIVIAVFLLKSGGVVENGFSSIIKGFFEKATTVSESIIN